MINQQYPSRLLEKAVSEFSKLPGVGRKTALRLVLHLLREEPGQTDSFAAALSDLRHNVKHCSVCHNISDTDVCPICANPHRDEALVCVVENIQDVLAIENTQQYNGLYHVLGGVISPMDGIGPNGEILMEYSIHDALRAGFDKVVFIIKPEMRELVETLCGRRVAGMTAADGSPVEVCYAYQDFSSVPAFYSIPTERTKPFGTGHAVLCARSCVSEPFIVINADDYYGVDAFRVIYEELGRLKAEGEATMVGYRLDKTVSEHGSVTRGVCHVTDGKLDRVVETFKLTVFPDGTIRDVDKNPEGDVYAPDTPVSMNFWGFTPWIFTKLEEYFNAFLHALPAGELKKECLLPSMVGELIEKGELRVSVLHSDAKWFGMTYHEDRQAVAQELARLHENGTYPATLRN